VTTFPINITAFDKVSNSLSPDSSYKSATIKTTQRKRLQEPKGKCAFGILGFPATSLNWHRAPEPSSWSSAMGSCWHDPSGGHGHVVVEVMPC